MKKNTPDQNRWPKPKFNTKNQPTFLFILTPPFSGSTALSELINTSNRTMILQERGEGQWLIPGMCENNRWNKEKNINYSSVKAVWLNKFQEVNRLVQGIDVVIEKSPPNIMRMEKLASNFEKTSFLANNRNPYANCSSILFRKFSPEKLSTAERIQQLENIASHWILRSKEIKAFVEKFNVPFLTYEQFCENPAILREILDLPEDIKSTIQTNSEVKVKDYEVQKIVNQNDRQISNLSKEEIKAISDILSNEKEVLDFFNYEIMR